MENRWERVMISGSKGDGNRPSVGTETAMVETNILRSSDLTPHHPNVSQPSSRLKARCSPSYPRPWKYWVPTRERNTATCKLRQTPSFERTDIHRVVGVASQHCLAGDSMDDEQRGDDLSTPLSREAVSPKITISAGGRT